MPKTDNQYIPLSEKDDILYMQDKAINMIDLVIHTMQNGKTQEERDYAANVLFMFCVESLNNK